MTWKNDVLEAMKRLDKESSLQEIYDQIPSIRPNLGSNWKARVRATLEENSSESEAWLGKDDLFFMVEKGSGIWSLKESNKNKDGFFDFVDVLKSKGLEPNEVQLIRHQSKRQKNMKETYYWLWKNDTPTFDEENAWQLKDKFKDRKYLCVFVVTPTKETLFAKFYRILGQVEKNTDDGIGYYYNLEADDSLLEFEGRLKIDWGFAAEKAWAQIGGNSPKKIISDGKVKALNELTPGREYVRKELQDVFGGNKQRGIVTLPNFDAIFLMPSLSNEGAGYEARWNDGVYHMSGEGLVGDQELTVGNKALAESINTEKPIYLFEPLKNRKPYTHIFHSQVKCVDFTDYEGPDKEGDLRRMFRFYFQSISHPDLNKISVDELYKNLEEELQETIDANNKASSISLKPKQESTNDIWVAAKEATIKQRKEQKVQDLYIDYLRSEGFQADKSQVDVVAKKNGKTIFIEAKILDSQTKAAHGLGQLLYYSFMVEDEEKPDVLRLLFDRKPKEETIEFIKKFNVEIVYLEDNNFLNVV